jgi:hypothetical protein
MKCPETNFPPVPQLNLEDYDDMQHLRSDKSSEDGNMEPNKHEIVDDSDEELHVFYASDDDNNPGETMEPRRMYRNRQQRRYGRLVSIEKEIPRKAAVSETE